MLHIHVWNVALCASEKLTIAAEEKRRIDAFEIWCYRRMMRIRCCDKSYKLKKCQRERVEEDKKKMENAEEEEG